MQSVRRSVMVGVGALVASLLTVVPTTSARADVIVPFPLGGSATSMLADSHGHLFVVAGRAVQVLTSDGSSLPPISVADAYAMALSPDGATVYVTGQDGISAIDTTSLIVTRVYSMAGCAGPTAVAFVGAALWFGGSRCGLVGPIGTLDLGTGTVTTIAQSAAESVVSVPGDGTTLLGYDGGTLTRWAVSGTAATAAAHTSILANYVRVDPASGDVLFTDGTSSILRLKMSDLTPNGSYPSEPRAFSLATSPALGGLVATGADGNGPAVVPPPPDMYIYRGGVLVRTETQGYDGAIMLAWAPDGSRLYALLATASVPPYTIDVLVGAGSAMSSMTIAAAASVPRSHPLSISGALSVTGASNVGLPVTVARHDFGGWHTIGTAVTTTGGAWAISDVPTVAGTATYTASYAGTALVAPASASRTVLVVGLTTVLTIATNVTKAPYGATVNITVHLGTTHTNRTVSLYQALYGHPYVLISTARVNSAGNAVFHWVVRGRTAFSASFAGDWVYAAARAVRTVWVYPRVNEVLHGQYTSIGGIAVFHHTVNPTLTGSMYPGFATCLRFQAQYYYSGTWYTAAPTSPCYPTTSTGVVTAVLTGTHVIGREYRMRADFPGTPVFLATNGNWVYLRFVT